MTGQIYRSEIEVTYELLDPLLLTLFTEIFIEG